MSGDQNQMLFKVENEEEMDDVLMISPGKHGGHTPGWILALSLIFMETNSLFFPYPI